MNHVILFFRLHIVFSCQLIHIQTCHRLSPVATHLLQLPLFSRLPVVFSCHLYQANCYTYKPATDCLQWLHTYFNYVCFLGYQWCSVVICIRSMVTPTNLPQTVSSGCTPTSTMFSMLPVVFSSQPCQDNGYTGYTYKPATDCLQWLHTYFRKMVTPTDLSQTLSSGYTPTSTTFVFTDISGVQLSAACHRLSPVTTHLLQLSLFSRLPVDFSCQLYQHNGYTYRLSPMATHLLQRLCFPGYQWCSVVSCLPKTVSSGYTPTSTVSSGYTPTSTVFVFQATSGVRLSSVSGQWLHLQTCHKLSPVAAHLLQLCFPCLPVVFSSQPCQDNGYTYKPATDCLQWLHTYFNYFFHATSCVQLSAVSGQWLYLQTCHKLSPVATHLLQLSLFSRITSGVQLSAACHRLSPVTTHLLQLSLFSRLPVVFSCQLYQDDGYTYKPATDSLQ